MSPEAMRNIELKTKDQHQSLMWHFERRFRITSSSFGDIRRRLESTPPDSLVLRILGIKKFSTVATQWGKDHEQTALEAYVKHQNSSGHPGLYACKSGFVISETHPFLGTSPDACVHDPSCSDPFGLVEIKCPYSHRDVTPEMACSSKNFCSTLEKTPDGEVVKLKVTNVYYSQVQGQMAITQRKWCDFVIYTPRGLSVERIHLNEHFWDEELLPKLTEFYDNCVGPEIVSPMLSIGLPIRNIKFMH